MHKLAAVISVILSTSGCFLTEENDQGTNFATEIISVDAGIDHHPTISHPWDGGNIDVHVVTYDSAPDNNDAAIDNLINSPDTGIAIDVLIIDSNVIDSIDTGIVIDDVKSETKPAIEGLTSLCTVGEQICNAGIIYDCVESSLSETGRVIVINEICFGLDIYLALDFCGSFNTTIKTGERLTCPTPMPNCPEPRTLCIARMLQFCDHNKWSLIKMCEEGCSKSLENKCVGDK